MSANETLVSTVELCGNETVVSMVDMHGSEIALSIGAAWGGTGRGECRGGGGGGGGGEHGRGAWTGRGARRWYQWVDMHGSEIALSIAAVCANETLL